MSMSTGTRFISYLLAMDSLQGPDDASALHLSNERFRHGSLDLTGKQIRLVRILRTKTQHLSCKIYHYDLANSVPDFSAVSYTWGPAKPTYQLLLNSRLFFVSANLYNFLRTCS